MSGTDDGTATSRHRLALAVGAVASTAALLSTPVLGVLGDLYFVGGLALAVAAPAVFGGVAMVAAGVLYLRYDASHGRRVAVAASLATLVGVAYGLSTVF